MLRVVQAKAQFAFPQALCPTYACSFPGVLVERIVGTWFLSPLGVVRRNWREILAGTALRGGEAQKHLITTRKCGQCARSPTRVTRDATRSSAHCAWTEVRNEQALAHAIRNSIESARFNAFRRSLRRPN